MGACGAAAAKSGELAALQPPGQGSSRRSSRPPSGAHAAPAVRPCALQEGRGIFWLMIRLSSLGGDAAVQRVLHRAIEPRSTSRHRRLPSPETTASPVCTLGRVFSVKNKPHRRVESSRCTCPNPVSSSSSCGRAPPFRHSRRHRRRYTPTISRRAGFTPSRHELVL